MQNEDDYEAVCRDWITYLKTRWGGSEHDTRIAWLESQVEITKRWKFNKVTATPPSPPITAELLNTVIKKAIEEENEK